jgi:hypothetical protein
VIPRVRKKGFAEFGVAEDVYWGDLGVEFLPWNLSSIPTAKFGAYLGSDGESEDKENLEVASLALSPDTSQNGASRVWAVLSPEADRFDKLPALDAKDLTPAAIKAAQHEGRELARLLIAAEALSKEVEPSKQNDPDEWTAIAEQIGERYSALVEEDPGEAYLGKDEAVDWMKERLGDLGRLARNTAANVTSTVKEAGTAVLDTTTRAASLLLYQKYRTPKSEKLLRFMGDVFVYLHRGRVRGDIRDTVIKAVTSASPVKRKEGNAEPFVLVTHSFGSMILYDALTSGALKDVAIDLWVSVGAQTSLFAEMKVYEGTVKPVGQPPVLGKPPRVTRWVNFYDPADILSYLHEPVFGKDAVTDIIVRAGANAKNAHGHYFIVPDLYRQIAKELEVVM